MTRILNTLIALFFVAHSALCATTVFSYAPRDAEPNPSGTGKKETYDIAIALTNPALVGKTITAIEIPVIPSTKVGDVKVWVAHELKLEIVNGKNANIVDKSWSVDMPTSGYITFVKTTLDEPYTIPEGGLYVGYSLTVNEINKSEGAQVPIVTTDGNKTGSFFMHTSRSYLNWADRSAELNVIALTQVELDGDFHVNAATLGDIPFEYIQRGADATIKTPVYNIGMTEITSIDYTATAAGETITRTKTLDTPIPARFAFFEDVEFDLPIIEETGDVEVCLAITAVNGLVNDATENTSATGSVTTLPFVPKHLALVEEFTGTWCGWCPAGFVAMEKMNELYPDFIGIAYHDRDPMAMKEGYPILASGFPEAAISRKFVTHPYEANGMKGQFTLPIVWEENCRDFVPVGIQIEASLNDDLTVTATSNVEWVIAPDDPDTDYRMEYVLVADDLTGDITDFSWWQHNYFGTEPLTPYMDLFCSSGDYVPSLHFNDVAILTSGTKGVQSSITTTEPGHQNLFTYTFNLAEAVNYQDKPIPYNTNKLRVVAFLLKGEEYGTVVNAAKCAVVNNQAGIAAPDIDNHLVKSVEYYDLQGRRIAQPAHGVCVRTIKYANGEVTTEKIIR